MASTEPVRIDQWLWAARFAKTRAQASDAVKGGHVEVNGRVAKPSRSVAPGDRVEVSIGPVRRTLVVTATALRRGSAAAAAELFDETPESIAALERHREERRLSSPGFEGNRHERGGRPTKRDRRRLDAARRRD
jgi:ribosome-associated heat shock protein Hsp15